MRAQLDYAKALTTQRKTKPQEHKRERERRPLDQPGSEGRDRQDDGDQREYDNEIRQLANLNTWTGRCPAGSEA